MKVVFVEAKGTSQYPHNGLAYLAGNIGSRHSAKIFDLNILDVSEEELLQKLWEEKPDLVGFSMKSFNLKNTLALAKKVKSATGAKLIVGGPHITLCANEFFEKDNGGVFDFGFQGEAEIGFAKFCDAFGKKGEYSKIPGLIYENGGKMVFNSNDFIGDLDSIKFPDFGRFENNIDFGKHGGYSLLTSRGCPYQCIYCSVSKVSGSKWRFRSSENVIDELKRAIHKYGIKSFQIIDDNFTLDMARAKSFCRLLLKENLNLRWHCPNGLRADRLDEELVELMKKSGCDSVHLGVESGDEKVFNFINKGEKLEDIAKAAKLLKKHGFSTTGFFIVGLPLETKKSVKKSLKFIDELGLDGVKWSMLVPYPKTFLWDWVLENGRFLKNFTDGQHFSKQEGVEPTFETDDYSVRQRINSYKTANLSTGSYYYVFQRPNNKILFYSKYALYLLRYNPSLFFKKTAKKLNPFSRSRKNKQEMKFKEIITEDLKPYLPGNSADFSIRNFMRALIFSPGFACVFLFRLNHSLSKKPFSSKLSRLFNALRFYLFGVDIFFTAKIGPGLQINHPLGIVIGKKAVIGKNCSILSGVTIGSRGRGKNSGVTPVIGDNVQIGSGANLFGDIIIGNNVFIGAMALCNKSVPDNYIAYGNPLIMKPDKFSEEQSKS